MSPTTSIWCHCAATSLNSYHSQTEPKRFEFLPKPCDPTLIPAKETGEEARIASQDYRGTINSNKIYNIGELPTSNNNTKHKPAKSEHKSIRELSEKTARSFGLKKAPAPMPPVLRKIWLEHLSMADYLWYLS